MYTVCYENYIQVLLSKLLILKRFYQTCLCKETLDTMFSLPTLSEVFTGRDVTVTFLLKNIKRNGQHPEFDYERVS